MNEQTRKNFVGLIRDLSIEQINQIPNGFNNNLIWNFGHMVVTQQLLVYKRSGLPMYVEDTIVDMFRKGSRPERFYDENWYKDLKDLSRMTIDRFKEDVAKGLFREYHPYTTSFGLELGSFEDAVLFNEIHEGMHLGYGMSLKRAVKNQ